MKQSRLMERIREIAGIARLNEMQKSVKEHLHESGDLVLYSPTGTGKTIAYAMSLLTTIAEGCNYVQAVVLVPSRELARQVGEVLRQLAEGYTVLACYGGHHMKDEMNSLEGKPNIIVATPGRLADLLNRGWVSLTRCEVAVIDEVDKILELGFEREMREVMMHAPNLKRKVVTSATRISELPRYVKLRKALTLDFLDRKPEVDSRMTVKTVRCKKGDKKVALRQLLLTIRKGKTIVFVNERETVRPVCEWLRKHGISAGGYHGQQEQIEREKVVAMIDNGSLAVLVATDLAARGLDLSAVENIVHYDLPLTEEIYTHRNGRTARVDRSGRIFALVSEEDVVPEFVTGAEFALSDEDAGEPTATEMATLYVNEGRKEKISRGDIVGWIANSGAGVGAEDIGKIVVNDHYSLVAVPRGKVNALLEVLNVQKIKGRRVRVSRAEASSG